MKKLVLSFCVLLCVACLFGCGSDDFDVPLSSGQYLAVGDYEEHAAPYLELNTNDKSFFMGEASIISNVEYGSFKVKDDRLIATSQNTTYVFKIKDSKMLVLIDNGNNDSFSPETEFVFFRDIE